MDYCSLGGCHLQPSGGQCAVESGHEAHRRREPTDLGQLGLHILAGCPESFDFAWRRILCHFFLALLDNPVQGRFEFCAAGYLIRSGPQRRVCRLLLERNCLRDPMDRSPVDFHWRRPGGAILAENVRDCGRPGHHGGGWQVKTAILIAIIVLADSAGDVLLTKGMRQVGEVSTFAPRALLAIARRAIRNHHFLASIVFMVTHFVGFLAVLSWADLSVVFPATTLVYVIGTLAAEFEQQFAKFCGVRHAIAVNSGTSSLEIILRVLGVEGKEVLVPTNTFFATAAAVVHAGARPVLVDMDPESFAVRPEDVEKKLTPKTAGLIVVHIGGIVSRRIGELQELVRKKGLWLVEDAAHAHGSSYRGV